MDLTNTSIVSADWLAAWDQAHSDAMASRAAARDLMLAAETPEARRAAFLAYEAAHGTVEMLDSDLVVGGTSRDGKEHTLRAGG